MGDCTLCSLISFFLGCIYNLASTALEYPIVVLIISFLIAVIFVTNIHSAKVLSELSCRGGNCPRSGGEIERTFDYGPERGPHAWRCMDTNQSPINIVEECVQKYPIRELLTWNHFDDLPSAMIIHNNGHTVLLRALFQGNTPTLSGADLLASYTFVELCFRWGQMNNDGSEHTINYRKFPLELQAMHRTGPAVDCTSSYDILMIAYIYEISSDNPYLEPLVSNLYRVRMPGTKVEIPPFPLSYLCHQFRTGFYSYGGSLTEPPCYQGAEWFIYPEPLAISERQINEFRKLCNSNGQSPIWRNARPVQNINSSRVVNLNQYNPLEGCQIETPESEGQCEEPPGDDESIE